MRLTIEQKYTRFETVLSIRYKYLKYVIESGSEFGPISGTSSSKTVGVLEYDVENFLDEMKPDIMKGLRK